MTVISVGENALSTEKMVSVVKTSRFFSGTRCSTAFTRLPVTAKVTASVAASGRATFMLNRLPIWLAKIALGLL